MLLIKNATIIDSESSLNGKKRDLLIQDGRIEKIGTKLSNKKAKLVTHKDLHVSLGWFDIGVHTGEPGLEHREDIQSITKAAAAGGYTGLACFPNTHPTIQTKSDILFFKNQSSLVDIYPIGAVSHNCEGKDIAEMYDMAKAGSIAFSDGLYSIQSSGLMKRSLEYVKGIEGVIVNHPHDKELSAGGQIHEGRVSTELGMKGLLSLSEELMLKRDIDLLAYTDSRLHVHNISTAGSIDLIKTAKKKGLKVTASVAAANLIFDDRAIASFDTNLKVLPPIRTAKDKTALIKAVKDGIIDCISTNHTPLEEEVKKMEFLYADFGMIALESTFAILNTQLKDQIPLTQLIDLLAYQSRAAVSLPIPTLAMGSAANLTLFSPNLEWTFERSSIQSKSKNTPFIGTAMKGKVLGIINKEEHVLDSCME